VSRFIRPEITTLHISNGDTLTVKKRLTHGERAAMYARMYIAGLDGRLRVNPLTSGMAVVLAYLVDWSFVGEDDALVEIRGRPIEEVEAALNMLDPASFDEVKQAVQAHEDRMIAEREAEKKTLSGARASSATSGSRSSADGGTSGSATSTPVSMTSSSRS
jgi:hypothetical protein